MVGFFQFQFNKTKIFFFNFLYKVFFIFFREHASKKIRLFIDNFSYVAMAEILGSVIGFPVKILVGRYLGPVEYGKYSLILNLAQFLIIPMIIGFGTSALRYISMYRENVKEIIGTLQSFFFITWSVSIIFFIFTKSWWIAVFGVPVDLFWWGLGFSALLSFYKLYESFNRGMHSFKIFAYTAIINSIVLLLIFLIFLFWFDIHTYQAFIISTLCATALSLAILMWSILKERIILSFHSTFSREMLKYSSIAIIGGLTGFLIGTADKFFINHYLSLYWVGIYAAYVNASAVFVGKFFQLFINVYFPTISGEKDKQKIYKRINKSLKFLIPIVFLISAISIWGIIWLFGKQFPIRLDLIILFSLNNCFYIIYQSYAWFLASQGVHGMKASIYIYLIHAGMSAALLFILVPWLGIIGALLSLVFVNISLGIFFIRKVRCFLRRDMF